MQTTVTGIERLRSEHQAEVAENARKREEKLRKIRDAQEDVSVAGTRRKHHRQLQIHAAGESAGSAWAESRATLAQLRAVHKFRDVPSHEYAPLLAGTIGAITYPTELATGEDRIVFAAGFAKGICAFYENHRAMIETA